MKLLSRIMFSFMALVGAVGGQATVLAQGSGLEVSPTRTELTVEAGETETFTVNINNVTAGTITANPVVYDFTPKEDGSPQIITDDSKDTASVSIKSFVQELPNAQLAPGEKTDYKVTIKVPSNQPAGSYYGVILFNALTGQQTPTEEGSGGQVALSASVGHIVLIQVPGNITEKMQLINAVAGRKDKDGKVTTGTLFSAPPTQMQITLRNTGNSILKPFGNISVEKGGKQVANVQLNNADVKANLLPDSNRVFTEELKDLKGYGRFTITVNAAYGTGGDILTQKITVWVIPAWLAGAVGAGVLAIAGVVFFMVRKFRR